MSLIRCLMLFCLLVLTTQDGARAKPLPALQADLSQTTVSGLSSGAYMAEQFAVAYSGLVQGAGLIAGGPYYCAGYPGTAPFIAYLDNAMTACMNPVQSQVDPPDAPVLWQRAQAFAQLGQIDAVANLARQRIYLFSGTQDSTVTPIVVAQALRFHQLAGVPAAQLRYVNNVAAGHGMITDVPTDNPCALTEPPYFNDCGIRQAQDILNQLYGPLNPPAAQLSGKLLAFEQNRYALPLAAMSLTGYVYVPAACATLSCRVHVAFHGCHQGAVTIGDHFYAHAGYNEVADTNRIVVLYPQVGPSYFYPYNPKGCWDFWGYTSVDPVLPDFYTRWAPQMQAVRAMLDRLAQPRSP